MDLEAIFLFVSQALLFGYHITRKYCSSLKALK